MPITPYLNGERFDPETRRVLGIALELACLALRVGECDEGVRQAIAAKLIGLARTGERNPDLLCEQALKDIRTPPAANGAPAQAASEDCTKRSPTPPP